MRFTAAVAVVALSAGLSASGQTPAAAPAAATTLSIDGLISLRRVGSPVISPDGKWVAYTVRETNWDDNIYETEIWLADAQSGAIRQLTNGRKSSNAPVWAPDGKTLAFGSDREDKRQIYLIDLAGGEAQKLTSGEESPGAFAWRRTANPLLSPRAIPGRRISKSGRRNTRSSTSSIRTTGCRTSS